MDMTRLADEMMKWESSTLNLRFDSSRWQVQVIMSGERGMVTYAGSGLTLEDAVSMAGLPTGEAGGDEA